jgi:hypothetical protein
MFFAAIAGSSAASFATINASSAQRTQRRSRQLSTAHAALSGSSAHLRQLRRGDRRGLRVRHLREPGLAEAAAQARELAQRRRVLRRSGWSAAPAAAHCCVLY